MSPGPAKIRFEHTTESVVGIDSKLHLRQWTEKSGEQREFRGILGAAVATKDLAAFESFYDTTIESILASEGLARTHTIYKSRDLFAELPDDKSRERALVAFFRSFAQSELCELSVVFSYLNSKYLTNGVKIFGEYGVPAKQVGVREFLHMLQEYFNVVVAWRLQRKDSRGYSGVTFEMDGFETIYPSDAWSNVTSRSYPRIYYAGDKTAPIIASADIILRFFDHFLKQSYRPLNDDAIRRVIEYDDKISADGIDVCYVGNPHLKHIVPRGRKLLPKQLAKYIKRPILFVSAGNVSGTGALIEELDVYHDVLLKAHGFHASVKVFDPKKDKQIIGTDSEHPDFFLPLNTQAELLYETLVSGGKNVKRLEL